MGQITLPVQYCELNVKPGVAWAERNFCLKTLKWTIKPEEAALVMVDVWDIHPYVSHLERGAQITRERIAPVAQACRDIGVAVIHAPSPSQATKYPQWVRYAGAHETSPTPASSPDNWPPADFRARKGKYAKFAKPHSVRRQNWLQNELPKRKIMPCVEPQPDDFVVANGDQLHRLLEHRNILHLFYAGFAANMCVLHRDYGICAMSRRGYNIILLRDCTTAIECRDTLDDMTHTKASVSIVEMVFGVSTTSAELLRATESSLRRRAKDVAPAPAVRGKSSRKRRGRTHRA